MGKSDNAVHPTADKDNNKKDDDAIVKKLTVVGPPRPDQINNNNNNSNIKKNETAVTDKKEKPKNKYKGALEMLSWLLGYFAFLVVGGYCITAIEHDNDKEVKNTNRLRLLDVLQRHGKLPNDTMVLEIIEAATDLVSVKGLHLNDLTAEVDSTWGFGGGIFFCATLVTTIGK